MMNSTRFSILLLPAVLFTTMSNSQTNVKPIDRLGVAGPIHFNNNVYNFAWSSHPSSNYFKQEYVRQGEYLNRFTSMFMIEVAIGPVVLKDVLETKITELKTLRASNPFISYDSSYDAEKQEYLLDFVITQNSADGKLVLIAERNVYRYKALPFKTGKQGIMLFAISTRSYGEETKKFLDGLKTLLSGENRKTCYGFRKMALRKLRREPSSPEAKEAGTV